MMNDAQREYTIKKIAKNKKTIKILSGNATAYAFGLGASALIFTISCAEAGAILVSESLDIIGFGRLSSLAAINGWIGAYLLKNMINSLAQKTGLEVMTKNLEYELNMDTLESVDLDNDTLESGGKTR